MDAFVATFILSSPSICAERLLQLSKSTAVRPHAEMASPGVGISYEAAIQTLVDHLNRGFNSTELVESVQPQLHWIIY